MENILVSVIVPFYNNSIYLKKCLESICCSTYKNIEILIVDDGSDEDIAPILGSISDDRVKCCHKTNGGVSSARNFGMRLARGELLFFVDPDDLMSTTIIERCVNEMIVKKVDAVVFGYMQKTEVEGEVIAQEMKIPDKEIYNCNSFAKILHGPIYRMYGIPEDAIKKLRHSDIQKHKQFSTVWCWCYKKSIIQEKEIQFHENLILYEDGMFNCEYLIQCNYISAIPEIGYEYFFRPSGATARLSYSSAMIENKKNLAKARASIRQAVQLKEEKDIGNWAYGSNILSVFQICSAIAGEGREGYNSLKSYIYMEEVQEAIKKVKPEGSFKFIAAFLLLKLRWYRILYILFSLLKKAGGSIRL